jgi:tyrosinase
MLHNKSPFTRRSFLKTGLAAAAGAASLPITTHAFRPPNGTKYIRYNVMSAGGQKALESYSAGIKAMLNLGPEHPQNWFRNAFIHLMDCPHGNWWFYVWHRGYLGYFEQTIRNLSQDPTFAIPYWDWTVQPEIPQSMFDNVRTPTDGAFEPYTKTLDIFTAKFQPSLMAYWNTLNSAQRNQLNIRGYATFTDMWNDVTGNGVPGNMGFATTDRSRYLTRENPKLDPETAYDCSPPIIEAGLAPVDYYNPTLSLSFTSRKTPSHMTPPASGTFSMLEGMPHNNVHNYIGGVGPWDPGPYGNMTNFLSPVDPIFFLHHANMDRLWDVWTRKQEANGYPILPCGQELDTLANEQFLFYVNGNGQYVGPSIAREYLSTARFDYEYEPGFGDNLSEQKIPAKRGKLLARGVVRGNRATAAVPSNSVKEHLASTANLVAEVTIPHPRTGTDERTFRVLVGAPEGATDVGPTSPYFAGTVAFFGNMSNHRGADMDATFAVPLPKAQQAFKGLAATNATVDIRIVPAHGQAPRTPLLRSATIRSV